jgi:hypothetical protein
LACPAQRKPSPIKTFAASKAAFALHLCIALHQGGPWSANLQ